MAEVTASVNLDMQGFRDQIRRADERWNSFASGMKKGALIIGGALAFKKVFDASSRAMSDFVKGGFQLNSQLQTATATFEVFTKSAEKANSIVEALRRRSDVSPFDTAETIEAGKALIASAKGSEKELMKLIKTAEVLAALKPEQGLQGAAFALKEAVGGDYTSFITRFDMSRSMVNKLKDEGKSGLDVVNTALKSIGAGPELVEKLGKTFEGQKGRATSFFTELQQKATAPMFDYLSKALSEFVGYMDGDGKDRMTEAGEKMAESLTTMTQAVVEEIKKISFDDIASGVDVLAKGMTLAAQGGSWLVGAVKESYEYLKMASGYAIKIVESFDIVGHASKFSEKAVGVGAWAADKLGIDPLAGYLEDASKKFKGFHDNWTGTTKIDGVEYSRGDKMVLDAQRNIAEKSAMEQSQWYDNESIDQNAIVDNWLKSHGWKREDLGNKSSAAYQAFSKSNVKGKDDILIGETMAAAERRQAQHAYTQQIDALLSKHGINSSDLFGGKGAAARSELYSQNKNMANTMLNAEYNSLPEEAKESIQADYRKARRQANNAARAQAVKVNINMITRSPTHDIMSI